jgi:hypothetical protein
MLAGLALIVSAAQATPATGTPRVVARVGAITASATSLQPGPAATLVSDLQITTTAPASDQLDAAVAPGDAAVGVYHRQVSVGEIPDLASCDGDLPAPGVVDRWLHYGPLLVPGRASAAAPPANATLTVDTGGRVPAGGTVAVTLYFATGGQVTLDLPVRGT